MELGRKKKEKGGKGKEKVRKKERNKVRKRMKERASCNGGNRNVSGRD